MRSIAVSRVVGGTLDLERALAFPLFRAAVGRSCGAVGFTVVLFVEVMEIVLPRVGASFAYLDNFPTIFWRVVVFLFDVFLR